MYPTLRATTPTAEPSVGSLPAVGRAPISRNVVLLGLTSLFTDISSEMVTAVLPLYLTLVVGFTPLQFGLLDGAYQGVTAFVRLAAGALGDRTGRHKLIATLGYGLSAVCKLGLLAAGRSYGALLGVVMVDRLGKGIRTSPRDALISLSSAPGRLATSFGVHRALDTTGAMLGPLVAFGVLALVPAGFDAVFVVSFAWALVGVAVIWLFVEDRSAGRADAVPPGRPTADLAHDTAAGTTTREVTTPEVTTPDAAGGRPTLRQMRVALAHPQLRMLTVAGMLLALAMMGDSFVYLILQRRLDLNVGFFPLLYVATSMVYLLLAVPLGRLADRFGRGRVFIAGHVPLAIVYLLLIVPAPGAASVAVALLAFGTYYAATDGVLMAMVSAALPETSRGTGIACVTTAMALARFGASVLFGALWMFVGQEGAVVVFLIGLLLATIGAGALIARAGSREAVGVG